MSLRTDILNTGNTLIEWKVDYDDLKDAIDGKDFHIFYGN